MQRALSDIVRSGIKDPRVSSLTSIVAVEVAPDLKTCKAWISVYGDEESGKNTLEGLKNAAGFIRSELARTVNIRNTPEITFILDNSIAYGVEMSKRIDEVTAIDKASQINRGEDPEETFEGETDEPS